MGRVILVASGKGGTGKTTTVANLGAALAMQGKVTVVVDMDMGLRNLDIALGLESNIVYDMCDVINGTCTIDEALVKDARYSNLYILSAPQNKRASDFKEEEFIKLWERLRERFDFCLIDSPAGVGDGFKYSLAGTDEAIIVTTPETPALRDADRAISVMEDKGIENINLIINKIRPGLIEKGMMMNVDDCVDMLQIPIIGIVANDDELTKASFEGKLSVANPSSLAGQAFLNISERILGKYVNIMDFEDKKSLFTKIKEILKA